MAEKGNEVGKELIIYEGGHDEFNEPFDNIINNVAYTDEVQESPYTSADLPRQRFNIAIVFIGGYLSLLFLFFLGVLFYNYKMMSSGVCCTELTLKKLIDVTQFMSVVSGFLGTPLAFILGYYFKNTND